MKKVFIITVLVLVIFFAGCDIVGPNEGRNLNLMPLSEDNSWSYDAYESYNGGLTYKESITISLGMQEYFNYNSYSLRGYPVSNSNSYILKNSEGVFEYNYNSSTLSYKKQTLINYPYRIGKTWIFNEAGDIAEWDGLNDFSHNNITYHDCYTVLIEKSEDSITTYNYLYFKDNIGMVGTAIRLNDPDGEIFYKEILTNYTISN